MERSAKIRRIRVPVEWQVLVLQGMESAPVERRPRWMATGVAVCVAIGMVSMLVPGF